MMPLIVGPQVPLMVQALFPESVELSAVIEPAIQETVRFLSVKAPAPDQVLWAAAEDVSVIWSVPQGAATPTKDMTPALDTSPERVMSPAPVFVQIPLAPTVTVPVFKL